MSEHGGRKIEPLPRREAPEGRGRTSEAKPAERLPSAAIVADAPPRLPSSAFVAADAAPPARSAPRDPAPATRERAKNAPRTPYVPPKLGQALPRGLRFSHPSAMLASQWLNSIVRTLRGMHMYADNNARRREFFDQTVSALERILDELSPFELTVFEDRIMLGPDLVHYSPDPLESLSAILATNGVRVVRFKRGIQRVEVLRFLGGLATDFSRPEAAREDLVRILGRLGLAHIEVLGDPEPEAARPAAPARPVVLAEPDVALEKSGPKLPALSQATSSIPALPTSALLPALPTGASIPALPTSALIPALPTSALLPAPASDHSGLASAAALPVDDGGQEPITVSAAPPLVPRADGGGFDDEATYVPSIATAEVRARLGAGGSAGFDDEATVLADSATARAIAALLVEGLDAPEGAAVALDPAERGSGGHELLDPHERTDPAGPSPSGAGVDDDTGDDFAEAPDTTPSLQSPFAGLDDIPVPEIARDLVLPATSPPKVRPKPR